MLVKILHQPQHLNELAPSGIAHSRLHQPAQTMNASGKLPVIKRRGLIERFALVLQQSEIMQGIIDKLRLAVAADSLRAGLATSAAANDALGHMIQKHLRHKKFETTSGYIRSGQLFRQNAAGMAGL